MFFNQTVPSLWCEGLYWNSATLLILRCSFHLHRWFFDKVKIKNFKRLGNSTPSKGFHPLVSSLANHQTGHARVILVQEMENEVNVYQQETSLLEDIPIPTFFFSVSLSQKISKCGKNISDTLSYHLVCHLFVLTTFWRHLWFITEQMHGNVMR